MLEYTENKAGQDSIPTPWTGHFYPNAKNSASEEYKLELRQYVAKAVEALVDPESPAEIRQTIWDEFAESYRFSELAEEMGKYLNVSEKKLYARTTRLLEFLASTYASATEELAMEASINAEYWGPEYNVTKFTQYKAMEQALNRVIEDENGSYLLVSRAKKILESMLDESIYAEKVRVWGQPLEPDFFLKVAPGQYGYCDNQKLYLIETDKLPGYQALLNSHSELTRQIMQKSEEEVRENGSYRWPIDVMRELDASAKQLFEASHIVGAKDLNLYKKGVNQEEAAETEQDLRDYQYLFTELRGFVGQEFDLDLTNLPLTEQYHFLQLLKYRKAREMPPVKEFVNRYRTSGLRTFLALDQKPGLGDKIVEFGNKHSSVASEVFAKFSDIIGATETAEPAVAANLLERASNLLERFIKREKFEDSELLEELDRVEVSNELFLATFKALSPEARARALQEGNEITIEEIGPSGLTKEDIIAVERIYSANYSAPEFSDLQPLLLKSFHASLDNPLARFPIIRHKGIIRGFMRYMPREDGTLHFGAFNVDPTFSSAEIGETMMEVSLDKEAQRQVIVAECIANSRIGNKYLARGFKVVREYEYGGIPVWDIIRDDLSARGKGGPALREQIAA